MILRSTKVFVTKFVCTDFSYYTISCLVRSTLYLRTDSQILSVYLLSFTKLLLSHLSNRVVLYFYSILPRRPEGTLQPAKRQWIREPLEKIRQQCLCAVSGAFKATNRQTLEKEAAIPHCEPTSHTWAKDILWCQQQFMEPRPRRMEA